MYCLQRFASTQLWLYNQVLLAKLYIGNLDSSLAEADIREFFAPVGEPVSIRIELDRVTGQSLGFGFVEMADEDSADRAIKELNLSDFRGRRINVSVPHVLA